MKPINYKHNFQCPEKCTSHLNPQKSPRFFQILNNFIENWLELPEQIGETMTMGL